MNGNRHGFGVGVFVGKKIGIEGYCSRAGIVPDLKVPISSFLIIEWSCFDMQKTEIVLT